MLQLRFLATGSIFRTFLYIGYNMRRVLYIKGRNADTSIQSGNLIHKLVGMNTRSRPGQLSLARERSAFISSRRTISQQPLATLHYGQGRVLSLAYLRPYFSTAKDRIEIIPEYNLFYLRHLHQD